VTHQEIEELLGAYALDALDADERDEVEAHLATCPRCRAEVSAHREVTAMLGNAVVEGPASAPEDLWDRISTSLQEEPPALVPVVRPSRGRKLALVSVFGAVAAGLILVVGLLAAKVSNLDNQVTSLNHQATVSSVILSPHRTVQLTSTPSAWSVEAVISASGEGYIINPSMPPLSRSQTFQLWALSRGKVVSLGVLGRRPNGAAIRVEPTMTVLMITAEPDHKLRALQAGAKDFLSKPLDLAEVRARAFNILEVRLLHMESKKHTKALEQTVWELEASREVVRLKTLEERKRLELELALAEETQRSLLPRCLPQFENYRVHAFNSPTRYVGGDFYDFVQLNSGEWVGVLADVSGKGMSAALLSSLLLGALSMEFRYGTQPPEVLNRVNQLLCERSLPYQFVTVFLFLLSPQGLGQFISAGHNPPICSVPPRERSKSCPPAI